MISQIVRTIEEADRFGQQELSKDGVLTGFSGEKVIGTLQRLAKLFEEDESACYLEVGVFQGLTLLSVADSSPSLSCYGIDNFAFFDPEGKNHRLVKERRDQLRADNAHIINEDYEDALENLEDHTGTQRVGLYFIDGPHDFRSQMMCLLLAKPYLHRQAVIVVDDANYRHVRQANRDFLATHPKFKLIFEAYTSAHPSNLDKEDEQSARSGWWNGINIIVRDGEDQLPNIFPPTERDRQLYENEHIVHAHPMAEFAPEGLHVLRSLSRGGVGFVRMIARLLRLYPKVRRHREQNSSRFPSMNTYSRHLPKARLVSPE